MCRFVKFEQTILLASPVRKESLIIGNPPKAAFVRLQLKSIATTAKASPNFYWAQLLPERKSDFNRAASIFSTALCITLTAGHAVRAETRTSDEAAAQKTASGTRYGLLDLLDHRSAYGQGAFPEPFLVDDSDLETGEARLDWLHKGEAINIAISLEQSTKMGIC
jgi:hypothetical protein